MDHDYEEAFPEPFDHLDTLTGWEEHVRDEEGAALGDPRRCPHHPHVQTSSPDGMFDAPCYVCEAEACCGACEAGFPCECEDDGLPS